MVCLITSLESAGDQIREVVGSSRLLTDKKSLKRYSSDQSFVPSRSPLMAVKASSEEEVQNILRIADTSRIPVTPYSTGANNQGAAIQSVPGIVLDLSEMTRIIDIDTISRNAVIEPGVTFHDLQSAARKKGLRVLTPIEQPSSASVLATYLEYVPTYSWAKYGDENLLTMHVVLPSGKLLRTGAAAYPVVEKPYDPVHIPFSYLGKIWFGSQGTLGVVTWGTVKLKNIHDRNEAKFISLDRFDKAPSLIRRIKTLRLGEELFLLNKMELALLLAKQPSQVKAMRSSLPNWSIVIVIRGDDEEFRYQAEDLKDICKKEGVNVADSPKGASEAGRVILKEIEDPRGWAHTSRYKGARTTLPFIAPIRKLPIFQTIVSDLAKSYSYDVSDIGTMIVPGEVSRVYYQYTFCRNPADKEQTRRGQALHNACAKKLISSGAFFYRPYGDIARLVYDRSPAYHRIIQLFKKTVDPNGIMNPGKLSM